MREKRRDEMAAEVQAEALGLSLPARVLMLEERIKALELRVASGEFRMEKAA